MEDFETKMRRGGAAAIEEASKFFMRKDPVHLALKAIARRLDQLAIPYAVAGGDGPGRPWIRSNDGRR